MFGTPHELYSCAPIEAKHIALTHTKCCKLSVCLALDNITRCKSCDGQKLEAGSKVVRFQIDLKVFKSHSSTRSLVSVVQVLPLLFLLSFAQHNQTYHDHMHPYGPYPSRPGLWRWWRLRLGLQEPSLETML